MAELKFTKEGLHYYIGVKDKDKEEKIEVPSSENVAGSVYDKFDLSYDQARKNYQKISEAYKKDPNPQNKRELEKMWFMLGQSMFKGELDQRAINEAKKKDSTFGKILRGFGVALCAGANHVQHTCGALDDYWGTVFLKPDEKANILDSWNRSKEFKYSDSDTYTYPFRFIKSILSKEGIKKEWTLSKKYWYLPPGIKNTFVCWKMYQWADKESKKQKAREWENKHKNKIEFAYLFWNDPLWLVGLGKVKLFKDIPVVGSLLKAISPDIWIKGVKSLGLGKKIATRLPALGTKYKAVTGFKPMTKIKNFFTRIKPVEAKVQQLPTGNKLMQNLSELLLLNRGGFLTKKKVVAKLFKKFSRKELNTVMEVMDSMAIINARTGKIISKDYNKMLAYYGKKVADGAVSARKITLKGWKPGTKFREVYWPHRSTAEGKKIVDHFFKKVPAGWRKAREVEKSVPRDSVIDTLAWIAHREDRHKILTRAFSKIDDLIKEIKKGIVVTPDDPAKTVNDLQELKRWLVHPLGKDIAGTPFATIPKGVKGVKGAGFNLLKTNDLVIKLQKRVQLAYNPAWYFKNFVDSQIIKNALADVPIGKIFGKSKLYKGLHGQTVDFAGVMARELMDMISDGVISKGLGRFGNLIENRARNVLGQHFLETAYKINLKKMAPAAAWKEAIKTSWTKVRATHFNYNELSAFDNIMKRVDPYWVYHTRNLGFIAREFLKRPALVSKVSQVREAAYGQLKKEFYSKLKAARFGVQVGRWRYEPTQWLSFNKLAEMTDPDMINKTLDKSPSNIARGFEILNSMGITPSTLLELSLSTTPLMEQRAYKTLLPQLTALNAVISGVTGKPTNLKHFALENLDAIMPEKVGKQWEAMKEHFTKGDAGKIDFLVGVEMSKQKQRGDKPNRNLAEKKISSDLAFSGLMGFFFGIYPKLNEPEDVAYRKTMKDLFEDEDYIKIDPTDELLKKTKETYPDLTEGQQKYLAQRAVSEKASKEERKRKAEIIKKYPWLQDRWSACKSEEMLKVQDALNKAREQYEKLKALSSTLAKQYLTNTNEGRFLEQTWGVAVTPVEAEERSDIDNLLEEFNERKDTGKDLIWPEVSLKLQTQITANPDLEWLKEGLQHNERMQKVRKIKVKKIKEEKITPTITTPLEVKKKRPDTEWDFEGYEKLPKFDKDKLKKKFEFLQDSYDKWKAHKLMFKTVEGKEVYDALKWEKLTEEQKVLVRKAYEDPEKSFYRAKIFQILKDAKGKNQYERYNQLTGKLKEIADIDYPYIRQSYLDIKIQKAIRNPLTGKIDFEKYEKLSPEAKAAAIKRMPEIVKWQKRYKEAIQAQKQHDWYVDWKRTGFKEIRLKRLAKENPVLYERLKKTIPEVGDIPIRTAVSRIMVFQKEHKFSRESLAVALNNEPEQAERIFKKYDYMEKLVEYDKKKKKWIAKEEAKRTYAVRRRIEVGPPKEIARQAALISSIEKSWSYNTAKATRAEKSAVRSAAYGGNKALESFERKRKATLIPTLPEEKKVYIPKPIKISPIEKATKERIRYARRSERLIKLLGPAGFSRSRYGRAKAILDK